MHLRGGNGVGKTTLLKLLAGILHPSHGEIRYAGRSINSDMATYQQQICYVGHKTGVSQLLTVRENAHFELHCEQKIAFNELMDLYSLQGLEDVSCSVLSVGQRRRVGLLRLHLSNASLWLLDEPLIALDKEAISFLMASLTTHLSSGGQVILTSHQNLPLKTDNYQEYCL